MIGQLLYLNTTSAHRIQRVEVDRLPDVLYWLLTLLRENNSRRLDTYGPVEALVSSENTNFSSSHFLFLYANRLQLTENLSH